MRCAAEIYRKSKIYLTDSLQFMELTNKNSLRRSLSFQAVLFCKRKNLDEGSIEVLIM